MLKSFRKTDRRAEQSFRQCVYLCPRFISGTDTHLQCVSCLGEEHARLGFESANCEHCGKLSERSDENSLEPVGEACYVDSYPWREAHLPSSDEEEAMSVEGRGVEAAPWVAGSSTGGNGWWSAKF
ncbi:hypothetical protein Baya_2851 [Bagarius yarrelli]|uniref:Uncharacterized protein n=1 Tax=Bagarius yarrelli TaxID=175774 RepID=A0A556TQR2_BAGYA|nr:hypothetical protein Baya_2851 [Bagarius yarrelli]